MGAPLVLRDLKELPGALFLQQMVFPAAGLGADAAVAVPSGHVIGQQAAPGKADAHGAVDKGLQLQLFRRVGAHLRDLVQQHFPRQHHAACPHVMEHPSRFGVDDAELGADVQRHARRIALCQRHDAQVRHDEPVHVRAGQLL